MKRITSPAIYDALRERYCAPQYALFYEVANGTGANIQRYADALAMSLFPSRGLHMHGFEVKVSRHDWQRELGNPHKAEEGIFKFCDHWWIVTPEDIVKPGELPPTWGHLELKVSGSLQDGTWKAVLRQAKAAPLLEAQQMSRSFIAALLRRADEGVSARVRTLVNEETRGLREKLAKVSADNEAAIREEVDERMKRNDERFKEVREFEAVLGEPIAEYGADRGTARILKAMKAAGFAGTYGGLERLATQMETAVAGIREHLAAFDALAPAPEEKKKGRAA
jgi:hypothetical protein